MKSLFLVLIVILLLACGVSSEQLTATATPAREQTQTAAPTRTATKIPTPTKTRRPTLTPGPTVTPEPTPAAIGETVQYKQLEITLLEATTHSHIVTGGYYDYYSKKDQIFIDLAVRVRNMGTNAVNVPLRYIYIVGEDGKFWYPNFSGSRTVEIEKSFNPMASLKLEETYSAEKVIAFQKDTYLRLVWYTRQNQSLLFGIRDWPQFAIHLE